MARVVKALLLLVMLAGIAWLVWKKTVEQLVNVVVVEVDRGQVKRRSPTREREQ